MKTISAARYEEQEHPKHVIYRMIGSRGFLWACGILGVIATTLLALGAQSYIQKQSVMAPEFMAYKSDTDTLKTQINVLAQTANQHGFQLQELQRSGEEARQIQGKIFDAIKEVSVDIHQVDNHVSALGAQVADQAEAVKEIREAQRK